MLFTTVSEWFLLDLAEFNSFSGADLIGRFGSATVAKTGRKSDNFIGKSPLKI